MYLFLILFFLSLAGITIMIGRKFILLKNGSLVNTEEKFSIKVPNLHEVKHIATKSTRKYGFIALVIVLRTYILSVHAIKKTYKKSKNKINKVHKKYFPHKQKEVKPKEVSGFLKMMSDYKQKVRKIKHQIKEEEGIQ